MLGGPGWAAEDFLDCGILKLCPAREKGQGKGRGHGSLVTDRRGAPGSRLGAPALLSTLPAPLRPQPTLSARGLSFHTDGETNCDLRNASDLNLLWLSGARRGPLEAGLSFLTVS